MITFTKDMLRSSIEAATGGKVTVLYDDRGYPSLMNIIPKFTIESVVGNSDYGTGVHPAFIVNGSEKSEIFIGQYESIAIDDRACSLPGQEPLMYQGFDQAKLLCTSKGPGWHLMTNWEWAAVSLWCLKNGFQPHGNTNYGQYHGATYENGVRVDLLAPGTTSGRGEVKTGTGNISWRHNNSIAGISDMVGNGWGWVDGFKLVDGEIFMPPDNDYIMTDDHYPTTNVFVDSTANDNGGNAGLPIVSDAIINQLSTSYNSGAWIDTDIKDAYTPPDSLYQSAIVPIDIVNPTGSTNIKNYGERMLRRGGSYVYTAGCGLFAVSLNALRDSTSARTSFRLAFIA